MKERELTVNVLRNTVVIWGHFCARNEKFGWTKADSNAMLLLMNEIKEREKMVYARQRGKKYNTLFKLSGEALFEAKDAADAFRVLAEHFQAVADSEECQPRDFFLPGTNLKISSYDNTEEHKIT